MALQNIKANVIVNNGKDSIISDSNSPTNPLLIKIGELCFDVKHDEEEKFLAAVSSVQPHMLIFKGINLCKQEKKFLTDWLHASRDQSCRDTRLRGLDVKDLVVLLNKYLVKLPIYIIDLYSCRSIILFPY